MRQNTGHPPSQSKTALRHELRSRRNNQSISDRACNDEAIGHHLLQVIKTRDACSIACFWPFNGEPDIRPVYEQLMSEGCKLALPVISAKKDHSMVFHSWHKDTDLGKNRYGIIEPLRTEPILLSSLDILIMPLVGYDRFGNRLGMGSGYYDRCLESCRELPMPLRVGVAYSLQEIEPIEKNSWDIPLHAVVNEHGCLTFVDQEPLNTFVEN